MHKILLSVTSLILAASSSMANSADGFGAVTKVYLGGSPFGGEHHSGQISGANYKLSDGTTFHSDDQLLFAALPVFKNSGVPVAVSNNGPNDGFVFVNGGNYDDDTLEFSNIEAVSLMIFFGGNSKGVAVVQKSSGDGTATNVIITRPSHGTMAAISATDFVSVFYQTQPFFVYSQDGVNLGVMNVASGMNMK